MGNLQQSGVAVQIGPYPKHEADWITEEALDSADLQIRINQILMGIITWDDFARSLIFIVESLHSDFQDVEKRESKEAYHE